MVAYFKRFSLVIIPIGVLSLLFQNFISTSPSPSTSTPPSLNTRSEMGPLRGLYVAPTNGGGALSVVPFLRGECSCLRNQPNCTPISASVLASAMGQLFCNKDRRNSGPPVDNVSGLVFMLDWESVESEEASKDPNARLDFSYFEKNLAALVAYNSRHQKNLKAVVGIKPVDGNGRPSWDPQGIRYPHLPSPTLPRWFWKLYQTNGHQDPIYIKTITPYSYMINGCLPMRVPAPWNELYLARWKRLVQKFGEWKRRLPADQRALIEGVQVIGLPSFDIANQLPKNDKSPGEPGNFICRQHDGTQVPLVNDIDRWLKVGYRFSLVRKGYNEVIKEYGRSFPDERLILNLQHDALPPIDSDGKIDKVTKFAKFLLSDAKNILGDRLNLQTANMETYQIDRMALSFAAASSDNHTGHFPGFTVSHDVKCYITGVNKDLTWYPTRNRQTPANMLKLLDVYEEGSGKFPRTKVKTCEKNPLLMQAMMQEGQLSGASHMYLEGDEFLFPDFYSVLALSKKHFETKNINHQILTHATTFASNRWVKVNSQILDSTRHSPPPFGSTSTVKLVGPEQGAVKLTVSQENGIRGCESYAFHVFTKYGGSDEVQISVRDQNRLLVSSVFNVANGNVRAGLGQLSRGFDNNQNWRRATVMFRATQNPIDIEIKLLGRATQEDSGVFLWAPQITKVQSDIVINQACPSN